MPFSLFLNEPMKILGDQFCCHVLSLESFIWKLD